VRSCGSFCFFIQRGEAEEESILGCVPSLFDPSFVPACDPTLSIDESEILELWESYHLLDCYPDNCVHRAAIFSDLLWQRDPLTSLEELFSEAKELWSPAKLAEWDPLPEPLPEIWYWSDDGFGDVEGLSSPFEYASLSETSDGEF
jgi:hypothetical protein